MCLEALKDRSTIEALAKKFDIHPNQISTWKREFIERSELLFDKSVKRVKDDQKKLIQNLYARIRALTVPNEFLKKGLIMSLAPCRSLIDLEHKKLIVRVQCKILGLSRSSFYHTHCTESEENLTILCCWISNISIPHFSEHAN